MASVFTMEKMKKVWEVVWRVLLFFGGFAVLYAGLVVPVVTKYAGHGGPLSLGVRLYIESASLAGVLAAVWLMLRFVDRRPFVSLGFSAERALRDSVVGLAIGLGMMTVCAVILLMNGWAAWIVHPAFSGSALSIAALAMLLNTVTQEVMVRGYVQQTIQSRFGQGAGVIVSSLFFLALHVGVIRGAVLPAISLFAAGILLATCYAMTGNLWLPIALHFGWNVLQGPVLGQAVSGQALDAGSQLLTITGPPLMTGGTFGVEGGLIAIAVTILGTPLVWLVYRRSGNRT